jgi:hypothetical protein
MDGMANIIGPKKCVVGKLAVSSDVIDTFSQASYWYAGGAPWRKKKWERRTTHGCE